MTDAIFTLELHSHIELYALTQAIDKRMDVLIHSYKLDEVIEYLTLHQIKARLPQVQKEKQ